MRRLTITVTGLLVGRSSSLALQVFVFVFVFVFVSVFVFVLNLDGFVGRFLSLAFQVFVKLMYFVKLSYKSPIGREKSSLKKAAKDIIYYKIIFYYNIFL